MPTPEPAADPFTFPAHWQPGQDGVPVRPAARVVLLDPGNRVLLMRYDGPPNGTHWTTPGGGVEPGEEYRAAALRELAEETGWTDIVLGGEIHCQTITLMGSDGRSYRQLERSFLARTDQARREISGVSAMHESDGIAAWRWWTLAELNSATEPVWPAELVQLIEAAILDGQADPPPAGLAGGGL